MNHYQIDDNNLVFIDINSPEDEIKSAIIHKLQTNDNLLDDILLDLIYVDDKVYCTKVRLLVNSIRQDISKNKSPSYLKILKEQENNLKRYYKQLI